jgi:hypothetical protein
VSRTNNQRVLDILDAADQIAGVVKDGRRAWDQDRLRRLAVERLLEIIGESANTLSGEFRAAYPDVPWRDVIGLRIASPPLSPRGPEPGMGHRFRRGAPPGRTSPSFTTLINPPARTSAAAQNARSAATRSATTKILARQAGGR